MQDDQPGFFLRNARIIGRLVLWLVVVPLIVVMIARSLF
jgi:hypothetical protein